MCTELDNLSELTNMNVCRRHGNIIHQLGHGTDNRLGYTDITTWYCILLRWWLFPSPL